MSEEILPPMPIKPVGAVGKCMASAESYRGTYMNSLAVADLADRKLAEAWAQDQAAHAENEAAIAHNKLMRARITAVMKAAGLPDEVSVPKPGSRSYPPKRIKVEAGYVQDLKRSFPIQDAFSEAQTTHQRLSKSYAEFRKKAEGEQAALVAAQEAEQTRREADIEFAMLVVRYGLTAKADWWDVLEGIRKRDKYLDLALAMRQVRGDWNDGCDIVSDALGRFTIENEQDKDIAAGVVSAIGQFHECQDGRIFRDVAWNYERIFALVTDQQLVADGLRAAEGARR